MKVALIGGTGFVGSYLTEALLNAGHELSMLVRKGSEAKITADGPVHTVSGDLSSATALRSVLDGCDAVIYNVGILRENKSRGITFEAMQYDGPVRTIAAAKDAGVSRLLLMSANGVKQPGTAYQETKSRADEYALSSGLQTTVFRPSVIFGDPRGKMEFATQLYQDMVRPPVPAVGFFSGWNYKQGAIVMSPVHVMDVADAFVAALENNNTIGQVYELGGPEVLTWTEIVQRISAANGRRKWILPMPTALMRVAATFLDWLPFFPVTRDQLTMLEEGNAADPAILTQLTGKKPVRFSTDSLSYLGEKS